MDILRPLRAIYQRLLRRKKHLEVVVLAGILIFALFILTYQLGQVPSGLNQDEAVAGYDAFSLAHTLRDHHGNFLPMVFQSFNDWCPPVLTYLLVPFVSILSLSEFSVRLPTALLGVGTVFLGFVIVKRLTGSAALSLLAAFLFATSPWLITTARWEIPPSIVPFFGLLFLDRCIVWIKKDSPSLWLSVQVSLSAGVLVHCYDTMKLFVPLMLLVFSVLQVKKNWKQLVIIWCIFLAITGVLYVGLVQHADTYGGRFNELSILNANHPAKTFASQYVQYFSYAFLFGEGDSDVMHRVPGFGALQPVLLPFFWAGVIGLFAQTWNERKKLLVLKPSMPGILSVFVLAWCVASPSPASLTKDPMHLLRTIQLLPIVIVVSCFGIEQLLQYCDHKLRSRMCRLLSCVLVLSILPSFFSFGQYYFGGYRQESASQFRAGFKEVFAYLQKSTTDTSQVIVDTNTNQPYIYYLFYAKYDPRKLDPDMIEKQIKFGKGGMTVASIGNYHFQEITPELLEGVHAVSFPQNPYNQFHLFRKGDTWIVTLN